MKNKKNICNDALSMFATQIRSASRVCLFLYGIFQVATTATSNPRIEVTIEIINRSKCVFVSLFRFRNDSGLVCFVFGWKFKLKITSKFQLGYIFNQIKYMAKIGLQFKPWQFKWENRGNLNEKTAAIKMHLQNIRLRCLGCSACSHICMNIGRLPDLETTHFKVQ